MTGWVITQIQFACEPLCCLLCSCVFLLTYKKQSLSIPGMWPACSSLFFQHQLVRGAMSGQDATLTEGERKWSHSSPTRSWKGMGNSEGKHWSAFCYISVDGEAVWMPLITAVPRSQTLPLWHWLRPAPATATTASCEQMGGTEQANMSCLMVYCKQYENFLRSIVCSDSAKAVKWSVVFSTICHVSTQRMWPKPLS